MSVISDNNELLNIKTNKSKPKYSFLKKIKRNSFFHNRTFASKFFLRITKDKEIESLYSILSTIDLPLSNRTKEQIIACLPFLISLPIFYQYISLYENGNSITDILSECCWILFRYRISKNKILKRGGEQGENFFILFEGKITVLDVEYEKVCLTTEEYLFYLLKLKILGEKHLIKNLIELNKNLIDIKDDNIEKYCNMHYKLNYNELIDKVYKEFIKYGFKYINNKIVIPNLDNYILFTQIKSNLKQSIIEEKKYYYTSNYKKIGELTKGRYFGDLSIKYIIPENYLYFIEEDCNLAYLSKNNIQKSKVFVLNNIKMGKILKNNIGDFYIFQKVDKNNFAKKFSSYFQYKIFQKDEKIFIQNGLYEGVYLLLSGEIEINLYKEINEISALAYAIQFSQENYREQYSNLSKENLGTNDSKQYLSNPIVLSKEFTDNTKDKKLIVLGRIRQKEALGLNEFYDANTNLCYFNVVCISEQCHFLYIPKKYFNEILGREKTVEDAVYQMIELKAKYYIGTLKKFKENILINIGFKMGLNNKEIHDCLNYNYDKKSKNKTTFLNENDKKIINNNSNKNLYLKKNINNNNHIKTKQKIFNNIYENYKEKKITLYDKNNNINNIKDKLLHNKCNSLDLKQPNFSDNFYETNSQFTRNFKKTFSNLTEYNIKKIRLNKTKKEKKKLKINTNVNILPFIVKTSNINIFNSDLNNLNYQKTENVKNHYFNNKTDYNYYKNFL